MSLYDDGDIFGMIIAYSLTFTCLVVVLAMARLACWLIRGW
jgi:hypothetical protein